MDNKKVENRDTDAKKLSGKRAYERPQLQKLMSANKTAGGQNPAAIELEFWIFDFYRTSF